MSTGTAAVTASRHVIASGHGLASEAGYAILESGGNAVDAGVAAGIALGVLHSDLVNVAGVAPIMLRMAADAEVVTIDGLGSWPEAASVEYFEREFGGAIPMGILRTVVPAAPSAWITALSRFGTVSFAEAAAAAIRYAREGFPVFGLLARFIADHEADYRRSPELRRIYLPGDQPPRIGEIFRQSDLAATLQYMADEEGAAGGDRRRGLAAAHDAFYRGDIARRICDHHRGHGGWLRRADLARYQARLEAPLKVRYGGHDIYCCGPWSQGISLAQAFTLLRHLDLDGLAHNSPGYIHGLTELLKLVFADREAYVADPGFVDVPTGGLLDAAYAAARIGLIEQDSAFAGMPPPGDPRQGTARAPAVAPQAVGSASGADAHDTDPLRPGAQLPAGGPASADTSYVCVIDSAGNMFSATPSDTSADAEMIPGTGLCPSSRGSQSRGVATSINAVAPGKRPRLTPNPALALEDGRPFMTFGTPGGDVQIQAMLQVYLNATRFDMDIQSAVVAPRFATYSFPSSFAPNDYFPGLLMLEERIDAKTGEELAARGHRVEWWPEFTWKAGGVCAIQVDTASGIMRAGADPRRAAEARGR